MLLLAGLLLATAAIARPAAPTESRLAGLERQAQPADGPLAELRAAAESGPLEKDLALRLAAAEIAAGRPEAAERQLRSVAERYESVRALLDLARLQARRGEGRQAGETLQRALRLAPNSEEVLSAFARVSLAAREPVPAIRTLEPLTRMHPAVAAHAYLLGIAWLQIAEYESAVESLERAWRLEPEEPQTLTALGLALNHQKRYDRARESLARSLEIAPRNAETLAALAEAEEGLGELAAAERHALQALSVAPDHSGARLVIGKVRMNQQRYEEARVALEEAIAADPTSAKAHYQLSLALARLGDREGSSRHLELYREALRQAEEYVVELRTKAGLGVSGMKR